LLDRLSAGVLSAPAFYRDNKDNKPYQNSNSLDWLIQNLCRCINQLAINETVTMPSIHSFQPIASQDAKALILGSMPGNISLTANQYYANPQNAFWRIVAELLGFDFSAPYAERIAALKSARIALWDVLQSCTREGSLDSRIARDSEIANNFGAFFETHKHITHVFFNGATAEACFKRHVVGNSSNINNFGSLATHPLHYCRLPSTSPANAAMSLADKYQAWQKIIAPVGLTEFKEQHQRQ
jgi:hypoxanthine-DNA glycosylase